MSSKVDISTDVLKCFLFFSPYLAQYTAESVQKVLVKSFQGLGIECESLDILFYLCHFACISFSSDYGMLS